MSNWKVGPAGQLYDPKTGAYVGQLDANGVERMVVSSTSSGSGMVISDGTKAGPVAGEAGGLTYDTAGRVATYQAFGVTWTLTYDASGRVASRTDGTTTQTAQYDSAGRFTGWA